jgi:hypothetical protein
MCWRPRVRTVAFVATFVLSHEHAAQECKTAYAAWAGFESPLRGEPALASCARDGHRMFWLVEADDARAALAQLPEWLAERSTTAEVTEVAIP